MNTRTERWSGELLLRYACATFVTWIAAAGAQLVVRSDFVVAIAVLSFLGIPISLYLRMHSMRVAGFSISRPLWNAFTVVMFFVVAGVWTLASMSDLLSLVMSGGASQSFWLRFGAEGSLALLMQVFLLFAAFRSFALISDKDATLATVPSFSVLLLLIPVHKGIEVVLYFLLWTLAATTLFALDHRAELRDGTNGRVPAPLPGQDARLAARGLATVLGSALIAAFSLSALLTSRNSDERSATESAITALVGRLAQFATSSSDSSIAGGSERQIDFSSGPALPSRTLLWKIRVRSPDGDWLRPGYFRLFSLSHYDGSSWTQTPHGQTRVARSLLAPQERPFVPRRLVEGGSVGVFERPQRQSDNFNSEDLQRRRPRGAEPFLVDPPRNRPSNTLYGFALSQAWPDHARRFGRPTARVRVSILSNLSNLGFLPLLPGTRSISILSKRPDQVGSGSDGSVDLGFIQQGTSAGSLNDVPVLSEYGFTSASAPIKAVSARRDSPLLLPSERARYLKIPALAQRTVRFAQNALTKAKPEESNYARAQRLALAIQGGATYTLHPPTPPTGREATDFFLFDGSRRGYCTHFASALTVLCRSQGIPARIVSGFAAHEYSSDNYALLREANAHAWAEVWIDHWGWAPVDATPTSDRGDNAPNIFVYWGDWIGFAFNQVEMWGRSRLWLVGLIGGLFVASIAGFRRRQRLTSWWGRRRSRTTNDEWTRREIIFAYESAAVRLAGLFRPRAPFETPDEWLAAANTSALDTPRARGFARHEFEQLTQHYLRALYAPHAPQNSTVALARNLAREVRRRKR